MLAAGEKENHSGARIAQVSPIVKVPTVVDHRVLRLHEHRQASASCEKYHETRDTFKLDLRSLVRETEPRWGTLGRATG